MTGSVGSPLTLLVEPGVHTIAKPIQDRNALPLRERRRRFMIFLHILLKYLEETNPCLNKVAKEEIIICVQRNREGHPAFTPLIEAIKVRLCDKVGDENWIKSMEYSNRYFDAHQKSQRTH